MHKLRGIENLLKNALSKKIISEKTTALAIIDFDGLLNTLKQIKNSFPDNFCHFYSIKANGLTEILKLICKSNFGAEVSSAGELAMSINAGFKCQNISYNSPVKTKIDISYCLENNISINIDNVQELKLIDALIKNFPNYSGNLGFRINTQIGSGAFSFTSTATTTSKFGYAIADNDNLDILIKIYSQRPWLTTLHTHTGSQGIPLDLMVSGAQTILHLAKKINTEVGFNQIKRLNIGGGLPIAADPEKSSPDILEYAQVLRSSTPELFSGEFIIETEFGRSVIGQHGIIISKVEYTKSSGGRHIALTHIGSQVAVRSVLTRHQWPIFITCFDQFGNPIKREPVITDVAGPCCFAGDILIPNTILPKTEPGDLVVIPNAGAYLFSSHFDFNSFPPIPVYSTVLQNNEPIFKCIRSEKNPNMIIERMS